MEPIDYPKIIWERYNLGKNVEKYFIFLFPIRQQ